MDVALIGLQACIQNQAEEHPTTLDSPFRLVENWPQLPDGLMWGQMIAVDMDADGNLFSGLVANRGLNRYVHD